MMNKRYKNRSFVAEYKKLLYCHGGHSDIYVRGYGHSYMYVGGARTPHLP